MSSAKKLHVELVRGLAGKNFRQKKIAKALGLGRTHSKVVHEDNPVIRGMIFKIPHLLKVTEE
jgi:large subunit ribosomal protein L30